MGPLRAGLQGPEPRMRDGQDEQPAPAVSASWLRLIPNVLAACRLAAVDWNSVGDVS
jgi:hypothetical protein